MEYYIYLHVKLNNGEPFYIGKGKGKRSESKSSRSNHWKNTVSKNNYDIVILESNLSESNSIKKEIYWINRIGRKDLNKGSLVNFTDGGEGTSKRIVSNKTREAVAFSNSKRIASKYNREAIGKLFKGKFGHEHNRSKSVTCLETSKEYGSMSEASRELNIAISSVSWSIKHKKPIFGMHFQVKD